MNPALIALLIQVAPTLIADVVKLFKDHPYLTPEALNALAPAVYATNVDTRATVAADQASQPAG